MKDFIKFTFATVLGIIISSVLLSIIGIGMIFSILASSDTEVKVEPNSIMTISLNGTISERANEDPFAMLSSDSEIEAYGLDDILSAIQKAKDNDNIKGIYLDLNAVGAQPATLQEIRNKLKEFKESGKFIISYSDNYSQGAYYLASVSDKVLMNPYGTITWMGVSSQFMSYKGLMDKVGVKMQIFKVGTYKSAVEPFILKEMSDANRAQVKAFTGSIWESYLSDIAESRNLTTEQLDSYANEGLVFAQSETFVEKGFVDTLVYRNDVEKLLKEKMEVEEDDDLNTISLESMKNVIRNVPKDKSGNLIAIYYAEGEIDDTKTKDHIGALRVIKDLKKIEQDDNIKALVLRVNSPGGSAFGSEQIWKQIKEIKLKKPVVVTMGDYAASGGYYISCNADYIFAQPTTLTGSIGIYGMIPEASELIEKVGINFETVGTNKFADMMSFTRPMTAEEGALLQKHINEGYELFVTRCADGRKTGIDDIKKIAEGRVWTGSMAKELGLVDELGGIDDAIEKAKQLAEIESYSIVTYPEKPSMLEEIMNNIPSGMISIFGNSDLNKITKQFEWMVDLENFNPVQARIPCHLEIQ